MRKRILVWILTIAMVMSVTGGSFVYADNLSNINSQISDKNLSFHRADKRKRSLNPKSVSLQRR